MKIRTLKKDSEASAKATKSVVMFLFIFSLNVPTIDLILDKRCLWEKIKSKSLFIKAPQELGNKLNLST